MSVFYTYNGVRYVSMPLKTAWRLLLNREVSNHSPGGMAKVFAKDCVKSFFNMVHDNYGP